MVQQNGYNIQKYKRFFYITYLKLDTLCFITYYQIPIHDEVQYCTAKKMYSNYYHFWVNLLQRYRDDIISIHTHKRIHTHTRAHIHKHRLNFCFWIEWFIVFRPMANPAFCEDGKTYLYRSNPIPKLWEKHALDGAYLMQLNRICLDGDERYQQKKTSKLAWVHAVCIHSIRRSNRLYLAEKATFDYAMSIKSDPLVNIWTLGYFKLFKIIHVFCTPILAE